MAYVPPGNGPATPAPYPAAPPQQYPVAPPAQYPAPPAAAPARPPAAPVRARWALWIAAVLSVAAPIAVEVAAVQSSDRVLLVFGAVSLAVALLAAGLLVLSGKPWTRWVFAARCVLGCAADAWFLFEIETWRLSRTVALPAALGTGDATPRELPPMELDLLALYGDTIALSVALTIVLVHLVAELPTMARRLVAVTLPVVLCVASLVAMQRALAAAAVAAEQRLTALAKPTDPDEMVESLRKAGSATGRSSAEDEQFLESTKKLARTIHIDTGRSDAALAGEEVRTGTQAAGLWSRFGMLAALVPMLAVGVTAFVARRRHVPMLGKDGVGAILALVGVLFLGVVSLGLVGVTAVTAATRAEQAKKHFTQRAAEVLVKRHGTLLRGAIEEQRSAERKKDERPDYLALAERAADYPGRGLRQPCKYLDEDVGEVGVERARALLEDFDDLAARCTESRLEALEEERDRALDRSKLAEGMKELETSNLPMVEAQRERFGDVQRYLDGRPPAWAERAFGASAKAGATASMPDSVVKFYWPETIELRASGDGPPAWEELVVMARTCHQELAREVGGRDITVRVHFDATSRCATCSGTEKAGSVRCRFGRGRPTVETTDGYELEVDPSVTTVSLFAGMSPDSATCKGTVRNLGDTPKAIEVECVSIGSMKHETLESQRVKLQPALLPPGAVGSYSARLEKLDILRPGFELIVYIDGKRVKYFNAYRARKGREALDRGESPVREP